MLMFYLVAGLMLAIPTLLANLKEAEERPVLAMLHFCTMFFAWPIVLFVAGRDIYLRGYEQWEGQQGDE
jgi:hypothetical protein